MKKGRLIVISAPSGCGKTTVLEQLLERHPKLKRSVSYTTRKPRTGEKNGRDYWFIEKSDFLAKRKQGFFLESADVFGKHYGTSKEACLNLLKEGSDIVLAIDVQGMAQVKRKWGKSGRIISIFLVPPSQAELEKRLRQRRTESEVEIKKRLRTAKREMRFVGDYDDAVINENVDQTVKKISEILKLK